MKDRVRGNHGSSPLARGTQNPWVLRRGHGGIIPACAGNTYRRWQGQGHRRDNPRLRGEHWTGYDIESTVAGSSPLARGTPGHPREADHDRGIIPACAGNTGSSISSNHPPWDHPRLRGEHYAVGVNSRSEWGSSPLARGTRRLLTRKCSASGIIPACAGNTTLYRRSWRNGKDHPRLRGEHEELLRRRGFPRGSSPLARGTPARGIQGMGLRRIIPACAGNTERTPLR